MSFNKVNRKNSFVDSGTNVVIVTSSKEDPDVTRCYEPGANSYIVKPVEFEGFVKAVAEIGMYWMLINHPPV